MNTTGGARGRLRDDRASSLGEGRTNRDQPITRSHSRPSGLRFRATESPATTAERNPPKPIAELIGSGGAASRRRRAVVLTPAAVFGLVNPSTEVIDTGWLRAREGEYVAWRIEHGTEQAKSAKSESVRSSFRVTVAGITSRRRVVVFEDAMCVLVSPNAAYEYIRKLKCGERSLGFERNVGACPWLIAW